MLSRMYEHAITLRAPVDRELRIWIEPWCDELALAPGTAVELHGRSPLEGQLQVQVQADGASAAVFGWPGSVLRIEQAGVELRSYTQPVPDFLTKEMVQAVFWAPPVDPPRRPWWRRWWRRGR